MSASASVQKPPRKIGKAVQDALDRGAPNVDLVSCSTAELRVALVLISLALQALLPNLTDLSAETLTDNVIAINSLCQNPRQAPPAQPLPAPFLTIRRFPTPCTLFFSHITPLITLLPLQAEVRDGEARQTRSRLREGGGAHH